MQALKSCYTSSPPLHIENEGAGEGGDRKGHADEDPQGTSRLWSRKVTARARTSKFNVIFVWGVINIPLPKPQPRWGVLTKGGQHYKLGELSSSEVLLVTACTHVPSS